MVRDSVVPAWCQRASVLACHVPTRLLLRPSFIYCTVRMNSINAYMKTQRCFGID